MRSLPWIPPLLLALGAAAAAGPEVQPAPAQEPSQPPEPEPLCVPRNTDAPQLAASGDAAGTIVACWKGDAPPEACFELSRAAAPRRIPEVPLVPPVSEPRASVRDLDASLAACAGTTCKPLGPTIRAAIAKAKALGEGSPYTTPHVSDDLRLLAIENKLFSIREDRRIWPRAPADLPARAEPPRLAGVELVGNLAIATWSTCAGPCLASAAVDGKGASQSRAFPGGVPLVLDDHRLAILPMEARATVTVLDRATGKLLGDAVIHDGTSPGMLGIAADAQALVAIEPAPVQNPTEWRIVWVAAPPGAPPAIAARQVLPACP